MRRRCIWDTNAWELLAFASRSITVDGQRFDVKLAILGRTFDPPAFALETTQAAWASHQGFASEVIYADAEAGVLVTAFAQDLIDDWHAGAQDPKLSAMVVF